MLQVSIAVPWLCTDHLQTKYSAIVVIHSVLSIYPQRAAPPDSSGSHESGLLLEIMAFTQQNPTAQRILQTCLSSVESEKSDWPFGVEAASLSQQERGLTSSSKDNAGVSLQIARLLSHEGGVGGNQLNSSCLGAQSSCDDVDKENWVTNVWNRQLKEVRHR